MPIHERDAWRRQYFREVACPPELHIPTDDDDAFRLNPRHRWIYDKLLVAHSQNLECGPHDTPPLRYPVFCKPRINLKGMGIDSGVLRNPQDFRRHCVPGRFWSRLLTGEHVSTDIAVVTGRTAWYRHTRGIPASGGTFDYWIIEAAPRQRLERYLMRWIRRYLPDYTGMLNVETIGGRIIELHLRFADQWPDLYGEGWLAAMVHLYERGEWRFDDRDRADGYSVVLFGPHGRRYEKPAPDRLAAYRAVPDVASIQITFDDNDSHSAASMPPGGFRLAVINSGNFAAAAAVRAALAIEFNVDAPESGRSRFGAQ